MLHSLLKRMTLLIWLVLKAWDEHFAHIATNQQAVVAERGWGPLNNNLLLHPEIQATYK